MIKDEKARINLIKNSIYELSWLLSDDDIRDVIDRIKPSEVDEVTEDALMYFKDIYSKEELNSFNSDADLKKEFYESELHVRFYEEYGIDPTDSIKWEWVYEELKK